LFLGSLLLGLAVLTASAGIADKLTAPQVSAQLAAGGDLRGADLSGLVLSGMSFTGLQASGSNWEGADLRGASFHGADLSGADLSGAQLSGALLENVNLRGARLTKADLAGARLSHVTLVGADLSGADLRGAQLNALRFSPAGDRFLPALALALDRLAPPLAGKQSGLGWAAGLSTTGFAFSLDSANLSSWPGTPVLYAPLATALEATGAQTTLLYDQDAGRAFNNLSDALAAGSLCLLPLDMSSPGQSGDGLAQPIWAVAEKIEGTGATAVCVVRAPPFGELRLVADQLNARWSKPAATMLTLGQRPQAGRYLMLIVKPSTKYTRAQMGTLALRNAVAALSDAKAQGSRLPGVAGLQQLASLMRIAVEAGDADKLAAFAAWGAGPRLDLAGARRLAADFLGTMAALSPADQATLLQQASTLYRTEANGLDSNWTDLSVVDMHKRDQFFGPVNKDLEVLNEAISAEQQALGLLQRVAGAPH
jgi:uncharacterized protein YjbI with pentapeptide repeats